MNILKVSGDGSAEFTTISEAISKAQPNSRILVSEGIYNESIVIDKPLEIIADGSRDKVILDSTGKACVLMQTESAAFRGFTVRGHLGTKFATLEQQYEFYGIKITQGQLTVEDCDIWTDFKDSVFVTGENSNPVFRKCKIHSKDNGVLFYNHSQGVIEDCEISETSDTLIGLSHSANPIIKNCLIHDGATGVAAIKDSRGRIENCEIFNLQFAGIYFSGCSTSVSNCTVYQAERGIIFGKNNKIENCKVFRVKKYAPHKDIKPDDFKG